MISSQRWDGPHLRASLRSVPVFAAVALLLVLPFIGVSPFTITLLTEAMIFAIWGLMRVLQKFSTWPFVVYRFVLGAVILAGVAMGWLV